MYIKSQKMWWVFVAIWFIVIFQFTALPTYTAINTEYLVRSLTHLSSHSAWDINYIIRKIGHLTVFGTMALFLFWATGFKTVTSWLLASICGALDEIHQLFVPGRSPHVTDVGIDSLGALLALGIAIIVKMSRSKINL